MTGQEMFDHIRELGNEMDVPVWVCSNCPVEEVPNGRAHDDPRTVFLKQAPTDSISYMTALHELGHLSHEHPPWNRWGRLREEAVAWRWALKNTLIELGEREWDAIRCMLETYSGDRRFKTSRAFSNLLIEARSRAGARLRTLQC